MITTAEIAAHAANMHQDGHTLDEICEQIRSMVPAKSREGMEAQTCHVLAKMYTDLSEEMTKAKQEWEAEMSGD